MKSLDVEGFAQLLKSGAELLDARSTEAFISGFIPTAIHIPFDNKFAERVKLFFTPQSRLLLVADAPELEAIETVLHQQGYRHIEGYLQDGLAAWRKSEKPIDLVIEVESDELMMDLPFDENLVVVDLRQPIEFAGGHLKDAINIPLHDVADPMQLARFEPQHNLYLHCGGGSRSVIAASLFKKHGFHNLRNIAGGWKKIKEEPRATIVKDPDLLN